MGQSRRVAGAPVVGAISPSEVQEYWPLLLPYMTEFARSARGNLELSEIRESLQSERRQCWVAGVNGIKAVALTERQKASVWLDFCTGEDREEWQDQMIDAVQGWAASEGVALDVFCRPGWAPFLKRRGFKEMHRHLRLEHG